MKKIKYHCEECKQKDIARINKVKAIVDYRTIPLMELARRLGVPLESVQQSLSRI